MPTVLLQPRTYLRLPALGGRRTDYRDSFLPGLILRVSPGGARIWSVVYSFRGRNRRVTLGQADRIELARARELAREIFVAAAAGRDPAAERLAAKRRGPALTVAELVSKCVATLELRPRTRAEWERIAARDIRPELGDRPAAELGRAEIRAWRERMVKRSGHAANAAFKVLRRSYSWAMRQDLLVASPCAGLGQPALEAPRDRWLRAEEIRRLLRALEELRREEPTSPLPDVVQLLLLTGLRRGEVLGLRREEIYDLVDGEGRPAPEARLVIPAARMKGALEHVVPLSPPAVEILRGRMAEARGSCLFPALTADRPMAWPSSFAARLAARVAAHEPWVIHGLRHTLATHLQDTLRVPDEVVALILAHRPPGLAEADAVYLRGRRLDERRQALARWAAWLERVEAGKADERVVAMKR
jgi:integrase